MKRIIRNNLAQVIIIMGFSSLAMSILQPVFPLYLTSIEVPPEILGLMFSVGMVGGVIGEGSWGWLADKVGIRIPMSIGTFIYAVVVLFFLSTQKIPVVFTVFFFWGIIRSAIFGPGRGFIGANAPQLKKATFMAIIAAIMSAARSLGALPSGFIVDTWGYQWVFFASSGFAVLGGLFVVFGLKNYSKDEPVPSIVSSSLNDEIPTPDQKFNYLQFTYQCIVAALNCLGLGISMTFLPLLATQVIGISATKVGILFTIRAFAAMVLSIPMGILADRMGKKIFIIAGLLLSALAMAGTAFAEDFTWLIVLVIINSLGMAMFSPAALGLLSESVPYNRQSTAMGFYGALGENTGIIAGAALGGFIWSFWGPRTTFLTGAVAVGLGALICLALVSEKSPNDRRPYSSADGSNGHA